VNENFNNGPHNHENAMLSITAKDVVAIAFRRKQLIVVTFSAIFIGALVVGIVSPASYQAHTKLLVKRERVDPVITPGQDAPMVRHDDVTEEELNSEVELLESDDVLRQVVTATGLNAHHSLFSFLGKPDEEARVAKATARLRAALTVDAVKKSNLISITYSSSDPKLCARVLNKLNETYIEKNTEVHRPQGQYKFYEQQAEHYKQELDQAEQQLKQFAAEPDGVSPQIARDNTLTKLSEFSATLDQTRAEMAATEEKIRTLKKQEANLPMRITTQTREVDDAALLQQYKSTLMNLELKRTELLTKYQETYPLVQEVDKQISDTKAQIADEESKPVRENTTDVNPTTQYVTTELAKAEADYSALQARAAATQTIVGMYRKHAEDLEQKGIVHGDLARTQKADEDNYLLYLKKQEEARMSDALDQRGILNVIVAEQPVPPVLPTGSPWMTFLLGFVLAAIVSAGTALTVDYLDPSFRTPAEVFDELNIPVLAAVPHYRVNGGNEAYSDGEENFEPVPEPDMVGSVFGGSPAGSNSGHEQPTLGNREQ
jgi:uncharacterized protein involved in exopolysaccharide biosynthesis